MKVVTKYEAEDGRLFSTEGDCQRHEAMLTAAQKAWELFDAGATVAEAFDGSGLGHGCLESLPPSILGVTKSSRFKISHWQCCDDHVYQIMGFRHDGRVLVGGKGGWSGYYHEYLSLRNLSSYSWTNEEPES